MSEERLASFAKSAGTYAFDPDALDDEIVARILALVQVRPAVDPSKDERSTVRRRIAHRMLIRGAASPADYLSALKDGGEEALALRRELTMSATGFFCDPGHFARLAEDIVPRLFEDQSKPIRVWVPGCATGEEAYCIAMLLLEEADRRKIRPDIQIFASDLDGVALAARREGRYPLEIDAELGDERLRRFFNRETDHFHIRRELRDIVLFARHNILEDPPFARVDLISCRHVLGHLSPGAQRRVREIFHFALRPGGMLLLGPSESADEPPGLFALVDEDLRIYRRLDVRPRAGGPASIRNLESPKQRDVAEMPTIASASAAHRAALERLGPPSALVDASNRVAHLTDKAGRYLQPDGGPLVNDIIALARPELRPGLQLALHRAFVRGESSLSSPVVVDLGGLRRRMQIQVQPVDNQLGDGKAALVFFLEGEAEDETASEAARKTADGQEKQIRELQFALEFMRSRLESMRHENERVGSELQVANEAIVSFNEKCRAASKELQLSKQETLAISEELHAVKWELKVRLEAETRALGDVQNLMVATDVGILFLDRNLCIKKFTPQLAGQFNITVADEGRPITHFTNSLEYPLLAEDARAVMQDLTTIEREACGRDGSWLLIRLRPYSTVEGKVDGVVITLVNLTERHKAATALRESEARVRAIMAGVADAIVTADETGRIQWVNRATADMFGFSAEELIGVDIGSLMPEPHRSQHQAYLENYLDSGKARVMGIGREVEAVRKDGSRFPAELNISETWYQGRKLFIAFLRDLTVQRRYEARLKRMHENRLASMANMATELAHELNQPLAAATNFLGAAQRRLDAHGGDLSAEAGKALHAATNQVLRAGRIIHRLRHFISNAEPVRARHNLHGLIHNVCELVAPALRESSIEVVLRLGAASDEVVVDSIQMEQVMVNLVRNADEAMSESSARRLTISTSLCDSAIEVAFADTGRGLSGTENCDLFLPFTTTKSEGLGVGLSISRSILEAHSGRMWASSNSEGGATFSFTLPLAPPRQK